MTAVASSPPAKTVGIETSPQALTVRDLTKQYPKVDHPAVEKLSMVASEGQLVALLGPSGCGKTTTLRMVAGLLPPTEGQIMVGEKDITHMPVHKRGMGMVFQSYALFPHMNVAENVNFGLKMRKVGKTERRQRVRSALSMVRLEHLAERRTAELSGGQQQRIALARALVVQPTLLLLDEPLSNLDAKLRESMRREIRGIQQRLGTTTLFVTHDQDEALDMADRIAVMNKGCIEQFGTPMEIFERPATKFVANFIGRANFIDVAVTSGPTTSGTENHYEIQGPGQRTSVRGLSTLPTDTVSLMVRPHNVRLDPVVRDPSAPTLGGPGTDNSFTLTGTVQTRSYTGNIVAHKVDCGNYTISTEALAATGARLEVGDEATVSWDAQDSFLVADDPDVGGQP